MARHKEGEPLSSKVFRAGSIASLVLAHGLTACGLIRPEETPVSEIKETPAAFTPKPYETETSPPPHTLTPTFSPTPIPSETPIPTPNFEVIDSENQARLEQALGGEILDLPHPRITSFLIFPWFAEEDKPKEAIIGLVWGEHWPGGVVTSADCLYDFYRGRGGLDRQLIPLLKIIPARKNAERVVSLRAQNSQFPFPIIDAKEIVIPDPETSEQGITKSQKCEQVKELERLQRFLASIDWKDLTRLSSRALGEFVVSFLKGLEEAGINVPFFP